LATALISIVTAFIVIGLIARHLPSLPFLDRIVLKDDPEAAVTTLGSSIAHISPVKKGAKGVALTPLRPAGRVQIGDDIVDVVADMGVIAPGTPVRVVSVDAFRTVVEPIVEPQAGNESIGS
jgi:membrane-bound serine protease (ClpP class)